MSRKPKKDDLQKEKKTLVELVLLFLAKLVGETLKDKLVRAAAVGVISAASNLQSTPPDEVPPAPQEVSQSQK